VDKVVDLIVNYQKNNWCKCWFSCSIFWRL